MKRVFQLLSLAVALLLSAGCTTNRRETTTGTVKPVSATPMLGTDDAVIIKTPAP